MSPEKELVNESRTNTVTLMTWYIREHTFNIGHSQDLDKHDAQPRRMWETSLNQFSQIKCSKMYYWNWSKSCKVQNKIIESKSG